MKLFSFILILSCLTVGCIESNLGYVDNSSEKVNGDTDRPNELSAFSISMVNPSYVVARIMYSVEVEAHIQLEIYDASHGGLVIELVNERHLPGDYIVEWNGTNINNISVPSNTYILMYEATLLNDIGKTSRLAYGKKNFKYFR